jgi:hypothetical protein
MRVYRDGTTIVITWRTYGLTINSGWTSQGFERFGPDLWFFVAGPLTLWHDATPPQTVGDRGVW